MKAVLFVVATVMAAGIYAQSCANTPDYENTISPVNCLEKYPSVKLPNYENVSTYYDCTSRKANLKDCPQSTYFSYPLQQCANCDDYIPTVRCNSLTINVTCAPINSTDTTTKAPTTVTITTGAPSTNSTTTTKAPTTITTTTPHPPTAGESTSTTANGDSGVITPSGTTIAVPGPPSPANPDVPSPETPVPTAPVIDDQPPTPPVSTD